MTPGSSAFVKNTENDILSILSLLVSNVFFYFLRILSATMNIEVGNVLRVPILKAIFADSKNVSIAKNAISCSKTDWNSYETSWDFTSLPLLSSDYRHATLAETYAALRSHWLSTTLEMQRLEEENNRIFIEAYGLQDELTSDVPLKEITLTCNPYYRYGGDKTEEDLEALLLADTMKEFISYSVGCMFGRYALEKPGLVLANQGESIEEYFRIISQNIDNSVKPESVVLIGDALPHCFRCDKEMHIGEARFILQRYDQSSIAGRPMIYCQDCCGDYENNISVNIPLTEFSYVHTIDQKWTEQSTLNIFLDMAKCFKFQTCDATNTDISFPADNDNVIPILDDDWFTDDISERFRTFLRLTFGAEYYEENLAFIEQAIGKDIRKYFIKDFYTDHMKRYKKRPIYWLFSSPKGSFNALIYMHRYRPDTVSVVLNDYLREFQIKLATEKVRLETIEASASSSPVEKTRATKNLDTIRKTIKELEDYERDILYPLATRQIEIDLDDGVKANYPKFGAALKKIPGLDAPAD